MADNVTTAAETNVIKTDDMKKVREVDFVRRFTGTILKKLMEALGVTRKIPLIDGTTMYYYTTEGTLQDGNVAEGEIIPLSHYERVKHPFGEISPDAKLLTDVQSGIRTSFFDSLKAIDGTVVGASTLQMVLAKSWGNLQVLFENDAIEAVHFLHPLTIADYLGAANITVQTAFGFNYITDFLGLGTVIMTSQIPQGQVISTAKENLIMYYVPITSDAMTSLGLTADETGFIGIKSGYATEERAQVESLIMSGIQFLVEYASGVVFGQIDSTPSLGEITVTSTAGTASGDSNIAVSGYTLGSGEKYVYKTGTSDAPSVSYGQKLTGWTNIVPPHDITPAASATKITVAAVDSNGRAQAAGSTTITKNT